jgi:hypothetical protein
MGTAYALFRLIFAQQLRDYKRHGIARWPQRANPKDDCARPWSETLSLFRWKTFVACELSGKKRPNELVKSL